MADRHRHPKLPVRVDPDLLQRLRAIAQSRNVTLQEWVTALLERAAKRAERERMREGRP